MLWFCQRFLAAYRFYAKSHTLLMSKNPFIKSHHMTLFNRALHQRGELDQPEVLFFIFSQGPKLLGKAPFVQFNLEV